MKTFLSALAPLLLIMAPFLAILIGHAIGELLLFRGIRAFRGPRLRIRSTVRPSHHFAQHHFANSKPNKMNA